MIFSKGGKCVPDPQKNMDVPAYRDFAAMFSEKLQDRRENEFF